MERLKYLFVGLAALNILFAILALKGMFEGKDLLPIVIAALSAILAAVFLWVWRKSPGRFKTIGFLAVVLCAFGLYYAHFHIYLAEKRSESRENSITVLRGNKAPAISYAHAMNLEQTSPDLSIYEGNDYTILNFWATWCAPCLKEMPLLDRFYQENNAKNIQVVGFTDYKAGDTTELSRIRQLVSKLDISYPILIDSTTQVRAQYRADLLPATALIDKQGTVLDYQIGINGAKKIMDYVLAATED